MFAKLFLLRGIAYTFCGDHTPGDSKRGRELLDDAFVLIQCLRSAAPEESVDIVLQAATALSAGTVSKSTFTRAEAVTALRKTGGDLDSAVLELTDRATDSQKRQQERENQKSHGLCENAVDLVDLTLVNTLAPMLVSDSDSSAKLIDGSNNMAGSDLAVDLLRLANNNAERALEIYREQNYDTSKVAELVDTLDQRLFRQGLLHMSVFARKKRRRLTCRVDETALATLISMGVDNGTARRALQKSDNDTEKALLWLTRQNEEQGFGEVDETVSNRNQTVSDLTAPTQVETIGEHRLGANDETEEGTVAHSTVSANHPDLVEKGSDSERDLVAEAEELLQQELGHGTEVLLDEYLGSSLDSEWRLLQKYRNPE